MNSAFWSRRAFALVDLVVLVAIIVLLVGLLVPMVIRVHETAARTTAPAVVESAAVGENPMRVVVESALGGAEVSVWERTRYERTGARTTEGWERVYHVIVPATKAAEE